MVSGSAALSVTATRSLSSEEHVRNLERSESMKMRSILVIAAAAVVLLAAAAPALARAEARATTDPAPVPYGWLLQLRGAKKTSMTSYAFTASMKTKGVKATIVDDNKTVDDPSDDLTYTGVALWRLVGRIDDKNPARFNQKLATTAPGYNVVVEAVDGFKVTYTSAEVATLKNALVVADRVNGAPLSLGTASIKNDTASWKPNWPLKLVSSDASIFGNRKPAGVARVSIEPATTAPVSQAAPF